MAIRLPTRGKEKPTPDAMTLTEHLTELRRRLMIMVAAFLVMAVVAFLLYNPILHALQRPYCQVNPRHCAFYVTAPLVGLASPIIFWQFWRFITPGLRSAEKRYAVPFVAASIALFLAGCALAYYIFPHALEFLKAIGGPELRQIYNPNQYLGLILLMMALFGITFEFPVVLVSLELLGVVTPKKLLSWWRWAVIGIALAAAIFTPSSDPFSMLALAVPLTAFYFVSIAIGKILGR